jgi:hypothetical protein
MPLLPPKCCELGSTPSFVVFTFGFAFESMRNLGVPQDPFAMPTMVRVVPKIIQVVRQTIGVP